ncbi:MAG: hypothetical protein ACOY3D_05505, partial [Candidatus Omnitrophota bacterium]
EKSAKDHDLWIEPGERVELPTMFQLKQLYRQYLARLGVDENGVPIKAYRINPFTKEIAYYYKELPRGIKWQKWLVSEGTTTYPRLTLAPVDPRYEAGRRLDREMGYWIVGYPLSEVEKDIWFNCALTPQEEANTAAILVAASRDTTESGFIKALTAQELTRIKFDSLKTTITVGLFGDNIKVYKNVPVVTDTHFVGQDGIGFIFKKRGPVPYARLDLEGQNYYFDTLEEARRVPVVEMANNDYIKIGYRNTRSGAVDSVMIAPEEGLLPPQVLVINDSTFGIMTYGVKMPYTLGLAADSTALQLAINNKTGEMVVVRKSNDPNSNYFLTVADTIDVVERARQWYAELEKQPGQDAPTPELAYKHLKELNISNADIDSIAIRLTLSDRRVHKILQDFDNAQLKAAKAQEAQQLTAGLYRFSPGHATLAFAYFKLQKDVLREWAKKQSQEFLVGVLDQIWLTMHKDRDNLSVFAYFTQIEDSINAEMKGKHISKIKALNNVVMAEWNKYADFLRGASVISDAELVRLRKDIASLDSVLRVANNDLDSLREVNTDSVPSPMFDANDLKNAEAKRDSFFKAFNYWKGLTNFVNILPKIDSTLYFLKGARSNRDDSLRVWQKNIKEEIPFAKGKELEYLLQLSVLLDEAVGHLGKSGVWDKLITMLKYDSLFWYNGLPPDFDANDYAAAKAQAYEPLYKWYSRLVPVMAGFINEVKVLDYSRLPFKVYFVPGENNKRTTGINEAGIPFNYDPGYLDGALKLYKLSVPAAKYNYAGFDDPETKDINEKYIGTGKDDPTTKVHEYQILTVYNILEYYYVNDHDPRATMGPMGRIERIKLEAKAYWDAVLDNPNLKYLSEEKQKKVREFVQAQKDNFDKELQFIDVDLEDMQRDIDFYKNYDDLPLEIKGRKIRLVEARLKYLRERQELLNNTLDFFGALKPDEESLEDYLKFFKTQTTTALETINKSVGKGKNPVELITADLGQFNLAAEQILDRVRKLWLAADEARRAIQEAEALYKEYLQNLRERNNWVVALAAEVYKFYQKNGEEPPQDLIKYLSHLIEEEKQVVVVGNKIYVPRFNINGRPLEDAIRDEARQFAQAQLSQLTYDLWKTTDKTEKKTEYKGSSHFALADAVSWKNTSLDMYIGSVQAEVPGGWGHNYAAIGVRTIGANGKFIMNSLLSRDYHPVGLTSRRFLEEYGSTADSPKGYYAENDYLLLVETVGYKDGRLCGFVTGMLEVQKDANYKKKGNPERGKPQSLETDDIRAFSGVMRFDLSKASLFVEFGAGESDDAAYSFARLYDAATGKEIGGTPDVLKVYNTFSYQTFGITFNPKGKVSITVKAGAEKEHNSIEVENPVPRQGKEFKDFFGGREETVVSVGLDWRPSGAFAFHAEVGGNKESPLGRQAVGATYKNLTGYYRHFDDHEEAGVIWQLGKGVSINLGKNAQGNPEVQVRGSTEITNGGYLQAAAGAYQDGSDKVVHGGGSLGFIQDILSLGKKSQRFLPEKIKAVKTFVDSLTLSMGDLTEAGKDTIVMDLQMAKNLYRARRIDTTPDGNWTIIWCRGSNDFTIEVFGEKDGVGYRFIDPPVILSDYDLMRLARPLRFIAKEERRKAGIGFDAAGYFINVRWPKDSGKVFKIYISKPEGKTQVILPQDIPDKLQNDLPMVVEIGIKPNERYIADFRRYGGTWTKEYGWVPMDEATLKTQLIEGRKHYATKQGIFGELSPTRSLTFDSLFIAKWDLRVNYMMKTPSGGTIRVHGPYEPGLLAVDILRAYGSIPDDPYMFYISNQNLSRKYGQLLPAYTFNGHRGVIEQTFKFIRAIKDPATGSYKVYMGVWDDAGRYLGAKIYMRGEEVGIVPPGKPEQPIFKEGSLKGSPPGEGSHSINAYDPYTGYRVTHVDEWSITDESALFTRGFFTVYNCEFKDLPYDSTKWYTIGQALALAKADPLHRIKSTEFYHPHKRWMFAKQIGNQITYYDDKDNLRQYELPLCTLDAASRDTLYVYRVSFNEALGLVTVKKINYKTGRPEPQPLWGVGEWGKLTAYYVKPQEKAGFRFLGEAVQDRKEAALILDASIKKKYQLEDNAALKRVFWFDSTYSIVNNTDLFSKACGKPLITRVAHKTTFSGFTLLQDGQPLKLRGGTTVDETFTLYDIQKLVWMGQDLIRTYAAATNFLFMDALDLAGAKVDMGLPYDVGSGYRINIKNLNNHPLPDPKDSLAVTANFIAEIKNHPALLWYNLGNEYESHPEWFGGNINTWLVAAEQAAQILHRLDPNHPVAMAISDVPMLEKIKLIRACPSIDVWVINTYRDLDEVFAEWRAICSIVGRPIPMAIGETGTPSLQRGATVEDFIYQAQYDLDCYRKFERNRDICVGLTFMGLKNNLSKNGNPAVKNPNLDPAAEFNEEYWGPFDENGNPKPAADTLRLKAFGVDEGLVAARQLFMEKIIRLVDVPAFRQEGWAV